MSQGASPAEVALYDECKRLVSLLLVLDWPSLEAAAKRLDPSKGSSKRLSAGIQKKDPKVGAMPSNRVSARPSSVCTH